MCKLMQTVRVLDGNLFNLFAVLMSLCDSDIKNQLENMTNFLDLDKNLDSI